MTRRLFHLLTCCLLALLAQLPLAARAGDAVEIVQAQLEASEDGYRLQASFAFELNRGLEDAIMRGVPLSFTTEVELTQPRWYWFDEKTLLASRTVRISYNVLTRRYHAAISGSLQQSFATLDDALSLIRHPGRWLVAEKGELKAGQTYRVAVRMRLDVTQLTKPFQVNALNNSDWQMASDWKRFNFRADDK
ncbi:DUF4390 domain-containing protein [Herminiimonas sp. CN]|uniref:DUF4390 domain-containing protein n=1 Tax=Herminiimonas sp. CN TaxID=1349818 RepID=UPI000473B983